jgi:glucosamine 6-phosphate synthetase-like amidotransferase/phosphosugar isomerase protein
LGNSASKQPTRESDKLAIVHNGVIENFDSLVQHFLKAGHTFKSATATEVLARLISHHYALLADAGQAAWDGRARPVPHAGVEREGGFPRH